MSIPSRPSRGLTETLPPSFSIPPATDDLTADSYLPGSVVPLRRPSLRKRFASSWVKRRIEEDDQVDIRGPMGLRLLHSSPEPLVDLIFVHGLRGGSTKTWRKGNDPGMFWPQFWLPMEPGLRHANTHSFGYDSDWASTKPSILNVHDFGQSLLEEMRNSPHLRKNPNGPIILLGHSMGGLVIKKAYILARDIPDFRDRIKCIFFLATPHRGSDYAAILNNILALSGIMSSRQYITDLTTGSTSAELINNDFGKHANNLPIFSFYETLRINLGFTSGLIVEKNSAILGPRFVNERVQYINANHREICKFDSIDDPSYITIKNALLGAVEDLLSDISKSAAVRSREQMKILESYLGISNRPDDHFSVVDGTCQWLDARDDFQEWRDPIRELMEDEIVLRKPSVFWVHANPGTGKTYLATHVVSELQHFQLECAYYYFHIGNKSSRSLAEFLRSIAYQMATSNAAVRQKLLSLHAEGLSFDPDDAHLIWIKVFKKGVFQSQVRTPQYWVIDAVDECSKYQDFFKMIKGEKLSFPLQVIITSRNVPDIPRLYRLLEGTAALTCIEIPVADSINDIRCYIQSRIEDLPSDIISDKQDLMNRILDRSNASFLWVRLVLDELGQVFSNEGVLQVLHSIPEGMVPYYERIVRAMAEKKPEKQISQAILLWTVVASRNLTISELSQALALDINVTLPNVKGAVEGLCGQLITVDSNSSMVNLVHPIAREFLLSEAAREFSISAPLAHERIALACLKLLCSNEMQPPRSRRLLGANGRRKERSPFLDYAITEFSEHLRYASVESDELLHLMDRFFRMNVLSWVEKIAEKGDLHCLVRTSKYLKDYLDRRANCQSILTNQVRNIDTWSMDLSRIVTRFSVVLLQEPSSIYFIIPPLCPSNSAVYRRFGKRPDGLEVAGFKQNVWDDCIASISFGEDSIPAVVACGENSIAVGMESGDINLYNHGSYEKTGLIDNIYPVDLVHITSQYVAVCTIRSVAVKDLEGNTMWENRMKFRCILLVSSDDTLIGVTQHGHILKWDLSSGSLLQDQAFTHQCRDGVVGVGGFGGKAPCLATISPDMEILALGYSDGTICLWDIQTGALIGWAWDEQSKHPSVLLFNPNPNIHLLLVIYANHCISLYDTWSTGLIRSHGTLLNMGILSASCSPDGRTLATVNTRGNLQIWDFETLSLLYQVLLPAEPFRLLSFTPDGSGIVEVTDSNMRIWSPTTLVRKNMEYQSINNKVIQSTITEGHYEALRVSRITAFSTHPSLPIVFAGKYTGQVLAFDTQTGQQTSLLYSHSSDAFIKELTVTEKNHIASIDANGILQVWKLTTGQREEITCESKLLQVSLPGRAIQLCFSTNDSYLLVATSSFDLVYSMKDGSCIGSLPFEPNERCAWRWIREPGRDGEERFSLLNNHVLRRYSADTFPSTLDYPEINLEYELEVDDAATSIRSASIHTRAEILVLEIHHNLGYLPSSTVFIFNLKSILDNPGRAVAPISNLLPQRAKHFIGFSQKTGAFVFLDRDSWICSIDLDNMATRQFSRYFFVPNEYMPWNYRVLPVKSWDNSIVFCLHGELAIIKNGLVFWETQTME